jgi:hypothetical protein
MDAPAIPGRILQKHHIGRYTVFEYEDQREGRSLFTGAIDGNPTSNSFDSIEEAIVNCIAVDRDGLNTQADRYFFKMTTFL